MKVLSTASAIISAVQAFRERLEEVAISSDQMEWGFPNGEREDYLTYTINTRAGQIQVGLPSSWETRVPHLIRFVKEQGPPSPDVEVNIPPELNRKVAGAYAKSGDDIWLCHRGNFTAFRGKIPKKKSFAYFSKWLQEVEDDNKTTLMIPVAAIGSTTFADDLGAFAHAVIQLKDLHKQNPNAESDDFAGNNSNWSKGREFEGTKTGKGSGKPVSYEYLHGPICNRLEDELRAYAAGGPLKFGRNDHVDAALIDQDDTAVVLFEVKTASLPSSQIYSAVGQLFYYRYLYGNCNSKMFVVLPDSCRSAQTEKFLLNAGIKVLYEQSRGFSDACGILLPNILRGKSAV